jgi:hypothetical protein
VTTPDPASGAGEFRTGPTAAAATQAVLDAIHDGRLRDGQLGGCGFWAAKAAAPSPAPGAATGQAGTPAPGWSGRGFTRPGPGAEVAPQLYRAALEDALAYTTDRDGCGDCDPARLCEPHAARAARARQYQQALERELEAGT